MTRCWQLIFCFTIRGSLVRLKLTLSADAGNLIFYNYHYHLSAAIYKMLRFGSPEFSGFLHNLGFKQNGKTYKLFTFALRFEQYTNLKHAIRLDKPVAYLYVSSFLIDDFIKNFVIGTFESQIVDLSELNFPIRFRIKFVETIPVPEFTDKISFSLLTPMVLSSYRMHNGKTSQYYLRAEDTEEANRILTRNLQNKYQAIYNEEINDSVRLTWDVNYLQRTERITKKITINQHGKNPIDVVGLLAPFELQGNPELIRTGYECGFGEKNSMGFGMAEAVNKE